MKPLFSYEPFVDSIAINGGIRMYGCRGSRRKSLATRDEKLSYRKKGNA